MEKDSGRLSGSRASHRAQSTLVSTKGFDPERVKDALIEARKIYLIKRNQRDALADDSLNDWEKYDFAAEVVEVIAATLQLWLPERDVA